MLAKVFPRRKRIACVTRFNRRGDTIVTRNEWPMINQGHRTCSRIVSSAPSCLDATNRTFKCAHPSFGNLSQTLQPNGVSTPRKNIGLLFDHTRQITELDSAGPAASLFRSSKKCHESCRILILTILDLHWVHG